MAVSTTHAWIKVMMVMTTTVHALLAQFCSLRSPNSQCSDKVISVAGDVRLIVLASLHHPGTTNQCGDINQSGVQALVALEWILYKLNGAGNESKAYIPGIKIGYDVYDDCGLPSRAVDGALELLPDSKPCDLLSCTEGYKSHHIPHLGFILVTSSNAVESAYNIISGSGSVITIGTRISSATSFPRIWFTVPENKEYAKYTANVILQLEWYYIVLIHTSDSASAEISTHLKNIIRSSRSCITKTYVLDLDVKDSNYHQRIDNIFNVLLGIQTGTSKERLGVVFVGKSNVATAIIKNVNVQKNRQIRRFQWLFISNVKNNLQFNSASIDSKITDEDTLYLAHDRFDKIDVPGFKEYLIEKVENPDNKTANPWMKKYLTSVQNPEDIILDSSVPEMITSVFTFVKTTKKNICHDTNNEKCILSYDDLAEKISNDLEESNTIPYDNFTTIDKESIVLDSASRTIYRNNSQLHYFFKFNKAGGPYEFQKIGKFDTTHAIEEPLIKTGILPSYCKTSCSSCIKDNIKFIYIPGDVLILGLFSLTESESGSFACGHAIKEIQSYLTLMAFINEVQNMETIAGKKIGALALNDCYNGFNISHLLVELFSKQYILYHNEQPIDMFKVRFAVGALSSGVTLLVADVLNGFHIPLISYGASSALLDNRRSYPYFLRTVPSDYMQSKAIMEVMNALNITFASAIFIDNNYGSNGILDVEKFTEEEHICLYNKRSVVVGYEENKYRALKKTLYDNAVRVIVFYGTLTVAKEMLEAFQKEEEDYNFIYIASEAWGLSEELLRHDTQGSLVFNTGTIAPLNDNFHAFLSGLTLQKTLMFPELDKFWELAKDCSFKWTPDKNNNIICPTSMTIHSSEVEQYANMQRIMHVMYAVQSISTACRNTQDCTTGSLSREYGLKMYNALVSVTLTSFKGQIIKPFSPDGNGAHGLTIHSIKRGASKNYKYEKVGRYTAESQLELNLDKVLFYNDKDKEIKPNELDDITCSIIYCNGICKSVEDTTRSQEISTQPSQNTPTPIDKKSDNTSQTTLYILIGFLCILFIIIILLIIFIIFIMRQSKQIKQLSEITSSQSQVGRFGGSTANIYDVTQYYVPRNDFQTINYHKEGSRRHDDYLDVDSHVEYTDVSVSKNVSNGSKSTSSKDVSTSNSSCGKELSTILIHDTTVKKRDEFYLENQHSESSFEENGNKQLNYLSAKDLQPIDSDNDWSDNDNATTLQLFDQKPMSRFNLNLSNKILARPQTLDIKGINTPTPHSKIDGGYLHVTNEDNNSKVLSGDNFICHVNSGYTDPVSNLNSPSANIKIASFSNPVCDSPTREKLVSSQPKTWIKSINTHSHPLDSDQGSHNIEKPIKKVVSASFPPDVVLRDKVHFKYKSPNIKRDTSWMDDDMQTDEVII